MALRRGVTKFLEGIHDISKPIIETKEEAINYEQMDRNGTLGE